MASGSDKRASVNVRSNGRPVRESNGDGRCRRLLGHGVVLAVAQTPVGALATDERQGEQYGCAVDYEMAGGDVARVRRVVFGGVDVRSGCGGAGRRFSSRRAAGGAVGVPLAEWFGLHDPGLGLQRPGARRVGSEPRRAAANPTGARGRRASTLELPTGCSVPRTRAADSQLAGGPQLEALRGQGGSQQPTAINRRGAEESRT